MATNYGVGRSNPSSSTTCQKGKGLSFLEIWKSWLGLFGWYFHQCESGFRKAILFVCQEDCCYIFIFCSSPKDSVKIVDDVIKAIIVASITLNMISNITIPWLSLKKSMEKIIFWEKIIYEIWISNFKVALR